MIQNNVIPSGPVRMRLKKYDFFPGELIEGNVILQVAAPLVLNDIYINYIISESWNVPGDIISAELSNKIVYTHRVGIGNILKINSALINLNPGAYDFPFKFKIPEKLPPIFEYPLNGQRGSLRHVLKAQIYSQYARGEGVAYLFIKSMPKTLNTPLNYTVPIRLKKMGMIDNGTTTLKVSYPQHYYPIRGKIPVTVEIDNTQGKAKVKGVNFKLVRRVQYKKIQELNIRHNYETVIAKYNNPVNVPANTNSQAFNFEIVLKDDTLKNFTYVGLSSNPYPRLADIFYAMPSIDSYAVKCAYYLVVSLEFAGLVSQGDAHKAIMPIFLFHQKMQEKEPQPDELDSDNTLGAPLNASQNIQENLINFNPNPNQIVNEIKDSGMMFEKPLKSSNLIGKKENDEIKENLIQENLIHEKIEEKKEEIIQENNINNENININNEIKEENNNINNINNINNEEEKNKKKEKANNFSINDYDDLDSNLNDDSSSKRENQNDKKGFSLFD
jgi:hypothetical protein